MALPDDLKDATVHEFKTHLDPVPRFIDLVDMFVASIMAGEKGVSMHPVFISEHEDMAGAERGMGFWRGEDQAGAVVLRLSEIERVVKGWNDVQRANPHRQPPEWVVEVLAMLQYAADILREHTHH